MPASTGSVSTHAQCLILVLWMPSAELRTTSLSAPVHQDTLETLEHPASSQRVSYHQILFSGFKDCWKIFSKIIFLFQRRLLLDAGPMMIVSRPWPASTLSVLIHATVEPTLSAMSTTTNLSASVLKVTLETLKLDVSKVGVLPWNYTNFFAFQWDQIRKLFFVWKF